MAANSRREVSARNFVLRPLRIATLDRMKARSRRTTAAYIPNSRWLAYAGAGAATALAGTNSVDAEIHYSGRLDVYFGPDSNMSQTFPLGEAGGYILLSHDPLG